MVIVMIAPTLPPPDPLQAIPSRTGAPSRCFTPCPPPIFLHAENVATWEISAIGGFFVVAGEYACECVSKRVSKYVSKRVSKRAQSGKLRKPGKEVRK